MPATGTRRRRWGRRLLFVVLAVSLLANLWTYLTSDDDQIGRWRSADARAEYLAAYAAAMATMPEPSRTVDVPTSVGTVRAYLFTTPATPDTTPMLLLPGWGSGAPMWSENLPGLLGERPVWVIDALGDAGMSSQIAPVSTPAEQAAWLAEMLTWLDVDRVHVVGHSFGGWMAMNFAMQRPDRVASVSLLDPVQTLAPLRWQLILATIPSSLPFLPQSWRDRSLEYIGGGQPDPNDPVAQMIAFGTQNYESERPMPTLLTDEELAAVQVPVFAALAGDSVVNADPEKAVQRARELVDDIEIEIWEGTSHSLPMERPAEIDAALLAFMVSRDR